MKFFRVKKIEKLSRHKAHWLGVAVFLSLCLAGLLAGRYWLPRLPWVSTLQSTQGERVDAQVEKYACLAVGCPSSGQSDLVEVIGNPAAHRYPECEKSYARNPWDLAAFGGRLYVGLGDSSNEGPSANAGPVPVYVYDPDSGMFEREATFDEEQIDRFYVFGSELLVPGTDPRQSWHLGNLYRRDSEGRWQKLRTLPRTIHALALARHDGRLFAGVSVTEAVPAGVGKERYGSAVAVSDDGGKSWQLKPLGGWRIFDFLQVRGRLYAADIFPGPGVQRWIEKENRRDFHAPLYEYGAGGIFRRRTDLSAPSMFPDTPLAGQRAAIIERAVPWNDAAAYLGAFVFGQGELPVRGRYIAEDLTPGHIVTRRVALPPGAIAWDLIVDGGQLQVLFAVRQSKGLWRNAVWSSADGKHWVERAAFTAVSFARSFERLGEYFYFGLGSLSPPDHSACTPSDQVSGTLLRLRADSRR